MSFLQSLPLQELKTRSPDVLPVLEVILEALSRATPGEQQVHHPNDRNPVVQTNATFLGAEQVGPERCETRAITLQLVVSFFGRLLGTGLHETERPLFGDAARAAEVQQGEEVGRGRSEQEAGEEVVLGDDVAEAAAPPLPKYDSGECGVAQERGAEGDAEEWDGRRGGKAAEEPERGENGGGGTDGVARYH